MRRKQRWGDAIRIARAVRGKTQTAVASGAGISSPHFSRVESGAYAPSIRILEAIFSELDIPFSTMARIAEDPEAVLRQPTAPEPEAGT